MKLKKKYWIAIICKVMAIAITFLISIFINRGLGVKQKGEYAYVVNLVEMFYVIFSMGIGQAYSTFKRNTGDSIKELFVALGLFHAFGTFLLGSILFPLIIKEHQYYIIILTSLAVLKVIIVMMSVIEESIKRNIIITFINILYLIALSICYFTKNFTLNNALLFYGLNDLVTIIILIKFYHFKPKIRIANLSILKEIYKTSLITMVVMLLISVNYHIDTIMLKNMTTSYYVGLYSVGVTFSNMFLLIPDAFKEVLFGDSTNKNFAKSTAISSIKVSLIASAIILVGFIILGKPVIAVLYGIDYISSYYLTLIIFFGSFSMIFFKILQPIYISHGSQKKCAIFLTLSAIVNIFLNRLLIPNYNSIGAAIATAFSYTVCGLLFLLDYIKES